MLRKKPGSISHYLFLLVLLAILPGLLIMLYNGVEQRRLQIENAKRDVTLLTRSLGEIQRDITESTRLALALLSLMPAFQQVDVAAGSAILADVLARDPDYLNVTLTDPGGRVLVSGIPFASETSLGDRKHFQEAVARRDFAVGEYIVSRVGVEVPAVGYAYPLLDDNGAVQGVLTAIIEVGRLARYYQDLELNDGAFVAVTDYQGIRLLYHPPQPETNPVGQSISPVNWEKASRTGRAGAFVGEGSDGMRRIIAFEPVRLAPDEPPYMYVWAGVPEAVILAPANAALLRNLLLLGLVLVLALGLAGLVGRQLLLAPIRQLVGLTRDFAAGRLDLSKNEARGPAELVTLHRAFLRMATVLERNQQELIKVKKLESVGVLAGGIAHDFNNILTAILGNINLCRLDRQLSEQNHQLLAASEKACLRAKGLTQQLLTFARGGEPIRERASLAEVVRDSAEFVLRGDKIACDFQLPDDLWLVNIDKGQISQVVQNIMLNAVEAMAEGGGRISVSAANVSIPARPQAGAPAAEAGTGDRGPAPGDYVRLTIADSGVGMEREVLERIFDPYFTTKQLGSGLGLAITHSIVSKHGGRVTVSSRPGEGSVFTIYLLAEQRRGGETGERPEPATGQQAAAGGRILVMDDDQQVRETLQLMLSRLGYQVVTAADGREAAAIYRYERELGTEIDLLIMDLTIPGGMGGREAVREILAVNPRAKVIVASGYSSDPVMADYRRHGFAAALSKPFRVEELTELLKRLLDSTIRS